MTLSEVLGLTATSLVFLILGSLVIECLIGTPEYRRANKKRKEYKLKR